MRILVLLLGLFSASASVADTATVVYGTRVNLRSGKTDTYRVIKALEPGTELQVLRLERAYVQVKTEDNEVGWLPLRLVRINTATPVAAPEIKPVSDAPVPDSTVQALRDEIQRAQRELKQKHTPEATGFWWMIGLAGIPCLLGGFGIGMGGLQAYYQKRFP